MEDMLKNSIFLTDTKSEPIFFKRVMMPWGDTDFYVLEDDISENKNIVDLIDVVNKNAFNAPTGPKELGFELKLKEGYKYKKSRKMLVKLLESNHIKTYSQKEMDDYCEKHKKSDDYFENGIRFDF